MYLKFLERTKKQELEEIEKSKKVSNKSPSLNPDRYKNLKIPK